jgi:hypothetical protein
MRRCLVIALLLTGTASATIAIDPGFWENYEPFGQYTEATIRDLIALDEGDLLDSARGSTGLTIRMVGRDAENESLVSARLSLGSAARKRVQIKVVPFMLPRVETSPPRTYRRQVTDEQAAALLALLDQWDFWAAPYSMDPGADSAGSCSDSRNGWIIEGFEPQRYQILFRSNCGGLEPAAAALRDFLLGLADVSP